MFKVGDAVRVKAGINSETIGPDNEIGFSLMMEELLGERMVVSLVDFDGNIECGDLWEYEPEWLEPWNESEEWDGEKWVPKRLAGVDCCKGIALDELNEITINGVTYVRKVVEQTNAEKLEQYFYKYLGEKIEKYDDDDGCAKIVHVSRTGNRVTVVYDAGE